VLVTLAPEVPGAIAMIEHLVSTGVRVAIGHTAATPEQLRDAIAAGATLATHLGNGCPHMLPRHPNVIWELLAADEVVASVIADGHHLPPSTLKSIVRAKGPSRTILVTDAIAAAGTKRSAKALAERLFTIADVVCELGDDGRVSLPGTPYLAGSSLTLDQAIANTVRQTGLPIETVAPMASTIPAGSIGMAASGAITVDWDPETCDLSVRSVAT
jgi:N-acetylglucosamine-6-phosphate deacetylase